MSTRRISRTSRARSSRCGPVQACSFWATCSLRPKHRTCAAIGKPMSARPVMVGSTRSTSRASPGPRSTATVCQARVLYCTATSTRTVSANSISCISGFRRKVNSSNPSFDTSSNLRRRSALFPSRPRSKSFVVRAARVKRSSMATPPLR